MNIKSKIKLSGDEQMPVNANLEIAFKSRAQRDAFILMLTQEDIDWEFDARERVPRNEYSVTIYDLSWGINIQVMGELISKIDGSAYWDD